VLEFLDPDRDQAFIGYLNMLDGPDSFGDLEEWLDDIDLFLEGLSNPDKIEELWERSQAKKLWDNSQSSFATCRTPEMTSPQLDRQGDHLTDEG